MLAVALTLRGARVHTLLCDKFLPGCQRVEFVDVPDSNVIVNYQIPRSSVTGATNWIVLL